MTKQILLSALICSATGSITLSMQHAKILERKDPVFQTYLSMLNNDPLKISDVEFRELNFILTEKYNEKYFLKVHHTTSLAEFSNSLLRDVIEPEHKHRVKNAHKKFKNIMLNETSTELNAVNCGYLFTVEDYNGKNIDVSGILYNTKNPSLCIAWKEYLKQYKPAYGWGNYQSQNLRNRWDLELALK
jgi:hypothetical protein